MLKLKDYFKERKEDVKNQFENIYGVCYDATALALIDKFFITLNEIKELDVLRKRIMRSRSNREYVAVAMDDALFALALFVTPRGKKERKDKHDSWKRTFDAFGELSIIARRISKSHLEQLNRELLKQGQADWPLDLGHRAIGAQKIVSSLVVLETRGRSQSSISFFAQKIFESLEDLIGSDLRRSYGLGNDGKGEQESVTFINSHPRLVHNLTCVVFPDATAKQVRAALKQIQPKKSIKNA